VALVAPCKGVDPDLAANLHALFRQWYPRYEMCFVVENETDPAVDVIRSVAGEHPQIPHRIVTAGLAADCGQKVHNLMRAVEAILGEGVNCDRERPPLPPLPKGGNPVAQPDVLAFVDSDACPNAEWLVRLVERIAHGKHSIATGYRWYVPATPGWANRLLSAINHTVVAGLGPHGFNLVWGGAWAIRTDEFKKLGLPGAWQGTLSDDLVVSRLAREAGIDVAYEPNCLVKSTADFDWSKLGEFLRRQFVVVRVYAPLWWWFGFGAGFITNLCFWGTLALACGLAASGGPWAIPLAGGLLWYLAGMLKGTLSAQATRPFVLASNSEYRSVSNINVWGWPLVSLAAWLAIILGTIGRTIVWRGIRYRLDSARHTTILNIPAAAVNLANGKDERDSHARTTTKAA
jgi:hypothetical protein